MAEFNSSQVANKNLRPTVPTSGVDTGGTVRSWRATLAAAHGFTLAQNDTLNLFVEKITGQSRVSHIVVSNGAFGAGATLDIGTTADPDRFAAGIDIATAGSSVTVALDRDALTDDVDIIATFTGANPADDQALDIEVFAVQFN